MGYPLLRKIGAYTRLAESDEHLVDQVLREKLRTFLPREDIVREGEIPSAVNIFAAGWGCSYKTLEDGRRQIVALFLPGDICDMNVLLLRQADHSIGTITAATVAEVSPQGLETLMNAHVRIRSALWWEQLVAHATQREWAVNLGQRTAFERIAHLMCEVFIRLRTVGLTRGDSCDFPLTQTDLGEATGLSTVHVNRTLQELRAQRLIVLKDRTLCIPDLDALKDAGLFDPGYLHLEHDGRHLDANA